MNICLKICLQYLSDIQKETAGRVAGCEFRVVSCGFKVSGSRLMILNTQYSILNTRNLILDTRYSKLAYFRLFPAYCDWILAIGNWLLAHNSILDTRYSILDTRNLHTFGCSLPTATRYCDQILRLDTATAHSQPAAKPGFWFLEKIGADKPSKVQTIVVN